MKKIIIYISIIIVLLLGIFFYLNNKKEKFYLEDKYYQTSKYIEGDSNTINKLQEDKESYILFTYLPYCTFEIPCDEVFKEFMDKYNISFYYIPFDEVKKSNLKDTVKYAPSVVLVNNGKVVSYLSADKDEDYNKYQSAEEFESWISKYIYLSKGEYNG